MRLQMTMAMFKATEYFVERSAAFAEAIRAGDNERYSEACSLA